jgi:hypothetical protein
MRTTVVAVGLLVLTSTFASGQVCPHVPTPGTQSALIYMNKADNSCLVDDGGYIKKGQQYKAHIAVFATGGCQTRVLSCVGLSCTCVNSAYQVRNLGISKLYDSSGATYFAAVSPISSTTQYLDTRVPEGTTNTGSSWPYFNIVGTHILTSLTNANSTACNLTPTQFPQDAPFTVNVLPCKPKFDTLESGAIPHFPPGPVNIYTPLSGDGIEGAIAAAASAWEAVLGPSGVTFTPTAADCGNAPNCLRITEQVVASCAETLGGTANSETGELTSGAGVVLRQGTNGWRTYGNALNYMLAHEMGHFLGLDDHSDTGDAPCPTSDSIMSDPVACNDQTLGANVGISNFLPVNNTVYGGAARTSCGFWDPGAIDYEHSTPVGTRTGSMAQRSRRV